MAMRLPSSNKAAEGLRRAPSSVEKSLSPPSFPKKPTINKEDLAQSEGIPLELMPPWRQMKTMDGREFFFNPESGEMTWMRPTVPSRHPHTHAEEARSTRKSMSSTRKQQPGTRKESETVNGDSDGASSGTSSPTFSSQENINEVRATPSPSGMAFIPKLPLNTFRLPDDGIAEGSPSEPMAVSHASQLSTLIAYISLPPAKNVEDEADKSILFLNSFAKQYGQLDAYKEVREIFDSQEAVSKLIAALTQRFHVIVRCGPRGKGIDAWIVGGVRVLMILARSVHNQQEIVRANGLSLLVDILKFYIPSQPLPSEGLDRKQELAVEVVEQAFRVIVNVATSDKNRILLGEQDAVEAVLRGLRSLIHFAHVQEAGCWAMRNLSVNEKNKAKIISSGGVKDAMAAMRTHPLSTSVQEQGAWALVNLSLSESSLQQMLDGGGLSLLINAVLNYPEIQKLQEGVTWAISNLCILKGTLQFLSANEQACNTLKAIKAVFPESAGIQSNVDSITAAVEKYESSNLPSTQNKKKSESSERSQQKTTDAAPSSSNAGAREVQPVGDVLLQGYLNKQGGRIKTWKKRWFVLTKSHIQYHAKNEIQGSPLGAVSLDEISEVREDTERKNGFILVTTARQFRLVAPSVVESKSWLSEITKAWIPIKSSGSSGSSSAIPTSPNVNASSAGDADNFFPAYVDKIQASELEGFVLSNAIKSFAENPKFSQLVESTAPYVAEARLSRAVYEQVIKSPKLGQSFGKGIYITSIAKEVTTEISAQVIEQFSQPTFAANLRKGFQPLPFQFSTFSSKGVRGSQEDRFTIAPYLEISLGLEEKNRCSFFGIFDGHGGADCAEYISSQIHVHLARIKDFTESIQESMQDAFLSVNDDFKDMVSRKGLPLNLGSTALVALIQDKTMHIGWAGDSLGCLYRKDGEFKELVVPHKPSLTTERKRIESRGGFIDTKSGMARVNGVLAVSRAFGNVRLPCISPEPDVSTHQLDETVSAVVLACDGLWDVMNAADVGALLAHSRKSGKPDFAKELVNRALELGSVDNVTVTVIDFEKAAKA